MKRDSISRIFSAWVSLTILCCRRHLSPKKHRPKNAFGAHQLLLSEMMSEGFLSTYWSMLVNEGFPAFCMGPESFAFRMGCQQFGFERGFFGSVSKSVFGLGFPLRLFDVVSSLCNSACGTSAW